MTHCGALQVALGSTSKVHCCLSQIDLHYQKPVLVSLSVNLLENEAFLQEHFGKSIEVK